jgi:cytochrome c oxidase subunit 2
LNGPTILKGAGLEGQDVAGLWWAMFALAAAVYVVVGGCVVYAILRGRWARREAVIGRRFTDDAFIVVGGIVVPVLILFTLGVLTVRTAIHARGSISSGVRVDVVARRWFWDVRYPASGVTTANEVRVPVGRAVTIRLTSPDVVHSFWVPDVAGKLDVIPGQTNYLRLTVTKPGTYLGECAEYCGIQHANMRFALVALPGAAFDRWLARRAAVVPAPAGELEARGEQVFTSEACAGCHTIKGTTAHGTFGPDLSDLGAREWLGALTVKNTPANLESWIVDPQSIKRGNVMPPTALDAADLRALVAYLESLK